MQAEKTNKTNKTKMNRERFMCTSEELRFVGFI